MIRTLLKSKIHRASVTEANIEYEGSVTIRLSGAITDGGRTGLLCSGDGEERGEGRQKEKRGTH
jgi:hypothetical protein